MEFKDVQILIANGESKTIENKKTIAELEKIGKSISGMLNSKGGYCFIGITDDGKIIGTEVTDSTKKKLTDFYNQFDPTPALEIEYISVPNTDKYVITFICKASLVEIGPVTYKGKAYYKTESGIELMQSEKYKQLLMEHAGLSKVWESINITDYGIDDLDHDEIIKTIKLSLNGNRIPDDEYTENIKEILINFDLIHNNKLNNAAMVLFAKKMPADYSQCFIRMGRFVDETMDDVIESKQMRGNAFQILNEAQNFIKRHIPISSSYDPNKFERVEVAAIPLLAIREALINAICHRDYSKHSGDISLLIFNNKLEIHNIGHLYGGLSIEQLSQKHPSRRRNERIAQVFFTRKLIDRWGGGTSRILRLCAEHGLPTPIFAEETDGFVVRFFFKEPIGSNNPVKHNLHLKERENEVLQILAKHKAMSLRMILEQLENPPASRTLGDDLANLKHLGLVDSNGIGKGAKWFLIDSKEPNGAVNGAKKSD